MLKPVQRLPQYKLLLEDYLRRINHDSVDFDDTTIALRIVSDAADHANNTIRQGVRMDIFDRELRSGLSMSFFLLLLHSVKFSSWMKNPESLMLDQKSGKYYLG